LKLLAIETSSDVCGIALLKENKVIFYREETLNREHAEKLPEFCKELISKINLKLITLNGVAISIGPGSFTGLRIGLSFAKGLAFSANIPLLPISTLLSITESSQIKDNEVITISHSHKNIVYFQKFRKKNNRWEGIEKPVSIEWEKLSSKLCNYNNIVHYQCGNLIDDLALKSNVVEVVPSAVSIGKAASIRYQDIAISDYSHLEPDYITSFKIG
tara:strand:+ start:3826 stop:4473 length:648 start_codon:yes stop_codon:yes gene_type:complete